MKAAVGRIRPDAVINELTSLPRHYTPAEMKAAAERDRKIRVDGNINLLAALRDAGVRRYLLQSSSFWYARADRTDLPEPRPVSQGGGATWADVVKTNTFVTDFDEFQKCADIRMRYLGVATPTSTTVGVARLAGPDFMIEIEAVAVVNS